MAQLNDHVKDVLEASGLRGKRSGSLYKILEEGRPLGEGKTFSAAVLDVFARHPEKGKQYAQTLYFAAALSFGPDHLFDAMEELWDGDDEEEEEEGDDDGEDEPNFQRTG